jgi:hypothetical protein
MQRDVTKTIEVEGRKFTVTKYTAMDGLKIAKLLLAKAIPAFQSFLPLIKQNGKADADGVMDSLLENLSLDTIADALDKVLESDFDYIVNKSLRSVEEQLKAGNTAVMNADGSYGVLDIEYDPLLVLRLTCEAVMWGCSGFFDGKRLTSVMKPLFTFSQPNPQT